MPVGTLKEVSFTSEAFSPKDRAQQFLFRRELGFALGRDLADQDIAGLDLGTDKHDARLIQLGQRAFAHVGQVGRDFFGAQLGIPRATQVSSSI